MKALITGASSGIGADFAKKLHSEGWELILVARREDRLNSLSQELGERVRIICCDLSDRASCFDLFEKVKDEEIDLLINNAGFGVFGEFSETELEKELTMIDTNITAVHILMKQFLIKFAGKNRGGILNVASSAAFLPGPLLSSYYATKSYVLRLTQAVSKELKLSGSEIYVGALCPGPVNTEFNSVAGVNFAISGLSSEYVVDYALKKMKKKKVIIIPGMLIRVGTFLVRFIPNKLLLHISYLIQNKKA